MTWALRPALPEDEPFLLDLYRESRASEMDGWGMPDGPREALLVMQLRARRAAWAMEYPAAEDRIILSAGVPVGRLLVDRSGPAILLVDVALVSSAQGRGLGSAVLGALLSEARASGVAVLLHVEKGNRAEGLYRRLGFVPTDEGTFHLGMRWEPSL